MTGGSVVFSLEIVTWMRWICDWQVVMRETGQCGLSTSISASQILAGCHLVFCGSGLRLWIFHDEHLTPCPERYSFFFFSLRCPEVQVCHRGVKSPCGPQAMDRIYNATIRWINFFPSWLQRWEILPSFSCSTTVPSAVCWHSLNALSEVFCKGERSNFNQFRGQPVSFQTVTSFPVWLLLSSNDLAVLESPWTSSVLNCWSRFCFVF